MTIPMHMVPFYDPRGRYFHKAVIAAAGLAIPTRPAFYEGGEDDDDDDDPPPKTFWETLPEDLRTDKTIAHYMAKDDPAGVAKALVEANKKLGERTTPALPGKDATAEEVAAFFDKLGRPQTADEYDDIRYPEGYTPSKMEEALHPEIKKMLHGANLTKPQAKAVLDKWAVMNANFMQELHQLEAQAEREGRAELQRSYPDTRRLESDISAAWRFGSKGDAKMMEQLQNMRLQNGGYLRDNAKFSIFLAEFGRALNEDGVMPSSEPPEVRYGTADDIDAMIKREYAKAETDENHPLHPESKATPEAQRKAREQMFTLMEKKYAK